jgi:hypothetical protein
MANEITASGSLSAAKGNFAAEALAVSTLRATLAGTRFLKEPQTIPTTAGGTAIKLGDLASIGWFFIKNLDPTNYVEILNAVSGAVFLKLAPGEFAMGRFASAVTAPAALANTASVQIEVLILEQ